ncbi:MAG: hypothetical protein IJ619_02260 [Eubacterium sp.]|nr:hypothetical protein [Eubacterium sp.]
MKRCIVCLKDIEDSAEECPYCGSYQVDLDSDFDMQYDDPVSGRSAAAPSRGRKTESYDRPARSRETAPSDRPAVKERTKSESIKAAATKNGSSSRILIVVAVILVLALAGTFIFLLKTGFFEKRAVKKTVRGYYEAFTEGDGTKYADYTCTPEMREYMEKYLVECKDVFGDISVDEYYKTYFLAEEATYEDVRIIDCTLYDDAVIQSVEKEFKDYYGIDIDIEKGYSVNTEFNYKPKDGSATKGANIVRVIKVHGKWYVYI